jgi:hypothetical protein
MFNRRIDIDTTGLSTGMRVWGSAGIDSAIATIGSGNITLGSYGNFGNNAVSTPVTLYFITSSPTAGTYTFSADTTYAFRDPASELPFGSFAGISSYT